MAAGPAAKGPTGLGIARGRLTVWTRRRRDQLLALVHRHPLTSGVATASLLLGLAVAAISFALQSHFSTAFQDGQRLSGWQNFLRLGAPWQALIPVALAGLLASWGAIRLRTAQPEPPVSLGASEAATAGQLRRALRTERRTVRIAFAVMTGLVGVVTARFLVYAGLALAGNRLAQSTLLGVTVELAFWLAAWAAFWNWNRCHRNRMEGWGVFEG
ncbi:MAG: hypothetical protein WCB86_07760 [Candidatus Dormiibacterota bacterium]